MKLTRDIIINTQFKLALKHINEHNALFAAVARPTNLETATADKLISHQVRIIGAVNSSDTPSVWKILLNFLGFVLKTYGDDYGVIKLRWLDFRKHLSMAVYVIDMVIDIINLVRDGV